MDGTFRVLLADGSEEYRLLTERMLARSGEFCLVGSAADGTEALEMARLLRPDIIVTDALLPAVNGFDLLWTLEDLVPGRIMTAAACTRELLLRVIQEQIHPFLPKPFDTETLLEALRQAAGAAGRAAHTHREAAVRRMLRTAGVPAHIKGYRYLCRAIPLVMDDPSLLHALTKALYPAVAGEFGTTAGCVERAIRSAVDTAWLRGDPAVYRALLGIDGEEKPSNGSFIAAVADKLRQRSESIVA